MCSYLYKDLEDLQGPDGTCCTCLGNVQIQVLREATPLLTSHKHGKFCQHLSASASFHRRAPKQMALLSAVKTLSPEHVLSLMSARARARTHTHTHTHTPLHLLIKSVLQHTL